MKQAFFIFFLFLTSCNSVNPNIVDEPIDDNTNDGFTTYVIKKGEHYSGYRFEITPLKTTECLAILTESCIYTINGEDQCDINKLFGLSDSNDHSEHSARFGWRYYNDRIEIVSYVRRNGNFYYEYMGSVNPNEVNRYKIEILDTKYRFTFNDKVFDMDRTSNFIGSRYRLYPYFGGNNVAPHDIFIKIKMI